MQQVRVYGVDDVRLDAAERPAVGADDVLLRVKACGICGSDLAYVAMGGLLGPGGEPMPLGHELSAEVAEFGSAVTGLEIGQRVVLNPLAADNQIGNGGSEGGFTPWLLVRNAIKDQCLLPLPESLSHEEGALVEPLSVAMHAINQAAVSGDDKVVVFGAGPIGMGAVACLRYRGVRNIVVIDMSEKRLQLARQLGASTIIHAGDDQLWQLVGQSQGTDAVHGMPVVASDVFIDAAGVGSVVRGIMDNCKFGARIVVVAMHKEDVSLPMLQVMAKELEIKGSMAYPNEFQAVIDMLKSGVDVTPMITHRFALADFHAAFDTARQADIAGKVVVEME